MKLQSIVLAFYVGLGIGRVLQLSISILHKLVGIGFLFAIGFLGFIYLEKEEEERIVG